MNEIKRKPYEERDPLKAEQLIIESELALTIAEHCVAMKQVRIADALVKFTDEIEAEIADAMGFYSLEDFNNFKAEILKK